jgi:hypothetical protein
MSGNHDSFQRCKCLLYRQQLDECHFLPRVMSVQRSGTLSAFFMTKKNTELLFWNRSKKFCASAALNCSIDCTNSMLAADERVSLACSLKYDLSSLFPAKPICNDADVRAGRWVKLYWDMDEDCGEGYDPSEYWPGILKEKLCCSDSQRCNGPGVAPPPVKCFGVKYSIASGYCAGTTGSYSTCAVSQTRADEDAASYAEARICSC